MNFLINVSCNLHKVMEQTTDPETKKQLENLWKNVCNFKRAQEAIDCSGIHTEETLKLSKMERSILSSSDDLTTLRILDFETFKASEEKINHTFSDVYENHVDCVRVYRYGGCYDLAEYKDGSFGASVGIESISSKNKAEVLEFLYLETLNL